MTQGVKKPAAAEGGAEEEEGGAPEVTPVCMMPDLI